MQVARDAPQRKLGGSGLASMLGKHVLLNGELWLMGASYFCISLVRTTMTDWSTVFLREAKGLPMHMAARCLFLMETGGFAGSLAAGVASDRIFGGRRGPIVVVSTAAISPLVLGMLRADGTLTLQALYFILGFFAYPVHVLVGLFAREVVAKNVSSSAGGFVKCIAQIGGACAGLPLGALQQMGAGWEGVFFAIACVAAISALGAIPLWSIGAAKEPSAMRVRNGTVHDFSELQAELAKNNREKQKSKRA